MSILFAPKKMSDFRLSGHQYCCADSIVDSKLPDGTPCLHYTLRYNDAIVSSSVRAEVEMPAGVDVGEEGERWYGLTYFFETYDKDPTPESIIQFHDNDPAGKSNPPGSIQVNNGRLLYMRGHSTLGNIPFDIGPLEIGKKVNIVMHIKFSMTTAGVIEVWKDGIKLVSKTGIVTNSVGGNYCKAGINKWSWFKDTLWSTVRTPRIFNIANFKVGDANSSYAEVDPSGAIVVPPTPVPNQPPVAFAGPNQTIKLPVNNVTLDGSKSADPDGKIVSFIWTESGKTVGNSSIVTLTGLTEGIHTYTLSVVDDKGASTISSMTVTVLAADPVPTKTVVGVTNSTTILYSDGTTDVFNTK